MLSSPRSHIKDTHTFKTSLYVYYDDTDAGGVVYHANYLKFAERARTEMLRSLQLGHTVLRKKYGIVFVVRSCTIDFLKPAHLDDRLTVLTSVRRVMGPVIKIEQQIVRAVEASPLVDVEVLCRLAVTTACINSCGEVILVPQDVSSILSAMPALVATAV